MFLQEYDLPTRPTKRSSRKGFTYYEATHGAVWVELDAMPPGVLRGIVRERIERYMAPWRLEQMVERQEREGLACLLAGGDTRWGRSRRCWVAFRVCLSPTVCGRPCARHTTIGSRACL
jgi:hypothetical protein